MANSATTPAAAPVPAKAHPVLKPTPVVKTVKPPMAATTYIAIVASISAFVVLVCLFVGYRLLGHIILDVKVLSKEATARSQLTTKLSDASTLVSNYNNLGAQQQKLISDALPTSTDFTSLVVLMDQLTSSSSVLLNSMSPTAANGGSSSEPTTPASSTSSSTTPTPYAFSVEVEGGYAQINSFFHNLELSARPMRVIDVNFKATDTGAATDLKADLDIQTYYQGQANIDDTQATIK